MHALCQEGADGRYFVFNYLDRSIKTWVVWTPTSPNNLRGPTPHEVQFLVQCELGIIKIDQVFNK